MELDLSPIIHSAITMAVPIAHCIAIDVRVSVVARLAMHNGFLDLPLPKMP